jgi:FtsZ-binding cell division protein ZapB
MSEVIQTCFDYAALPVDVALKAQLAANSIKLRLKRTVEDIIEIGRELTAVKDELPHGQFEIWIKDEFQMNREMANNFMQVATRFGGQMSDYLTFKPTVLYALAAPSTPEAVIDKAIAKAESGDKVTVADVKDWKAIEAELEAEKRRNQEWSAQSTSQRQQIEALERRIDLFDSQPKPKPVIKVVEKIPDDYEALKAKAAQLETELATNKAEQTRIIQSAIKAKLSGYQGEVDALEAKKNNLEKQAKEYQDYLASLTGKVKQMESQARAFEKTRQALVDLASELRDFAPIDPDLTRKALALAEMTHDATNTLRLVFEPARPELTLIQGTAA